MPYTPPSRQSSVSFNADANSTYTHTFPHINPLQNGTPPSPGSQRSLPRSASSSSLARTQRSRDAVQNQLPREMAPHRKFSLGEGEQWGDDNDIPQQGGQQQSLDSHAPASICSEESVSSQDSNRGLGDEGNQKSAQRNDQLEELGKAVRLSLNVARAGSPELPFENSPQKYVSSGQTPQHPEPGRLSATARKISHSRSSTESAIMFPSSSAPDLTALAPSDGSEEEDSDPELRPGMLRKKSGEPVKPAIRPPNRRKVSSMPGTPTFSKKGVHFNDELQQVRHFLQVDRPIAVSAGGSPVEVFEEEKEFPFTRGPVPSRSIELRLGNFPRESYERQSLPVRLERINLSFDQKTLLGSVAVANLAFHKVVAARFTFDNWRTVSEVTAEYSNLNSEGRSRASGYDIFDFNVKLSDQANLEHKTMFICIRYQVGGNEYWDNNNSRNFKVEFVKRDAVGAASQPQALSPKHIPRSRQNSAASHRLRSSPSIDDEFAAGFESFPTFNMGNTPSKKHMLPDAPPPRRQHKAGQPFGTRYDFGTSLSAALINAQSELGEKSGIKARGDNVKSPSTSNPPSGRNRLPTPRIVRQPPGASDTESPRPDSLLANKQPVGSSAYQEFLSKFCFFGSGKPQGQSSQGSNTIAGRKAGPSGGDATQDEAQCPTEDRADQDLDANQAAAQGHSGGPERLSELISPGPRHPKESSHSDLVLHQQQSRCGSRSPSPISFGYSYSPHNNPNGIFPHDHSSAPAIHG